LGRIVAAGDTCTKTDLLRQPAYRMQEVHIVASEVVHTLQRRHGRGFQSLVPHQASHHSPVLLLHVAAVVLAIRPSTSERDVFFGAIAYECRVQELTAAVGVQSAKLEWQPFLESAKCRQYRLGALVANSGRS
jgi:hypothetical protein